MKTIEEKIRIMSAALAGAKIEMTESEDFPWEDVETPDFNWSDYDYRIKPENKQVPYDFSDAENLIGRKVRHKKRSYLSLITDIDTDDCVLITGNWVDLEDLMNDYEIWNNTLNRWESCTKTVKE